MTIRVLTVICVMLALAAGFVFANAYPDPIIYDKPVRGVIFSHKDHVEKGLSCEMCHDALFTMQAKKAQENDDFTMDSLYKGKYCGACHNGSMAFASNTRCATCHIGVKGEKRMTGGSKAK